MSNNLAIGVWYDIISGDFTYVLEQWRIGHRINWKFSLWTGEILNPWPADIMKQCIKKRLRFLQQFIHFKLFQKFKIIPLLSPYAGVLQLQHPVDYWGYQTQECLSLLHARGPVTGSSNIVELIEIYFRIFTFVIVKCVQDLKKQRQNQLLV